MAVLKALQEQSIFHWDFITKVITAFLGHTIEEQEKRKAFVSVLDIKLSLLLTCDPHVTCV